MHFFVGDRRDFPAMNGDVDPPSTMNNGAVLHRIFQFFCNFWRYLKGLDISKKNMGIHGTKKYRRKSGICPAELAQQVELSGKHWMSAKSYTRIEGVTLQQTDVQTCSFGKSMESDL